MASRGPDQDKDTIRPQNLRTIKDFEQFVGRKLADLDSDLTDFLADKNVRQIVDDLHTPVTARQKTAQIWSDRLNKTLSEVFLQLAKGDTWARHAHDSKGAAEIENLSLLCSRQSAVLLGKLYGALNLPASRLEQSLRFVNYILPASDTKVQASILRVFGNKGGLRTFVNAETGGNAPGAFGEFTEVIQPEDLASFRSSYRKMSDKDRSRVVDALFIGANIAVQEGDIVKVGKFDALLGRLSEDEVLLEGASPRTDLLKLKSLSLNAQLLKLSGAMEPIQKRLQEIQSLGCRLLGTEVAERALGLAMRAGALEASLISTSHSEEKLQRLTQIRSSLNSALDRHFSEERKNPGADPSALKEANLTLRRHLVSIKTFEVYSLFRNGRSMEALSTNVSDIESVHGRDFPELVEIRQKLEQDFKRGKAEAFLRNLVTEWGGNTDGVDGLLVSVGAGVAGAATGYVMTRNVVGAVSGFGTGMTIGSTAYGLKNIVTRWDKIEDGARSGYSVNTSNLGLAWDAFDMISDLTGIGKLGKGVGVLLKGRLIRPTMNPAL